MKRPINIGFGYILLILLTISSLISCTGPKHSNLMKQQTEGLLNADLIFVYGRSAGALDNAIMNSTGEIVHVGIIEVDNDSVYVIDAAGKGVSRRPLEAFLNGQRDSSGIMPKIIVKRLIDRDGAERFIQNAKDKIGLDYDWYYLEGNDKYYCSELVYDCYIREGEHIFKAQPMNFRNEDGTMPAFWSELYDGLGVEVPEGMPGTNPNDMSKSDILMDVDFTVSE